jgi:hypothetical protein
MRKRCLQASVEGSADPAGSLDIDEGSASNTALKVATAADGTRLAALNLIAPHAVQRKMNASPKKPRADGSGLFR